jgi:hypothetical protein
MISCVTISELKVKVKYIIVAMMASSIAMIMGGQTAYGSHSSSPAACEGDGLETGQNGEFSQGLYEMCGEIYYDAFIEGCMSVEGNTRDVCESATDAGSTD